MGVSSTAPAVRALLAGALILGAIGTLGADYDDCPEGCSCSRLEELDMECELTQVNVSVKGKTGPEIQVICDSAGNFTFDEIPQINYGQGQGVRLKLLYCNIPSTFTRAATQFGASYIQQLYIENAPNGVNISLETVKGLEKLERLAIYSDKSHGIAIPAAAFSQLPALQRFTINNANVTLHPEDFTNAPNLIFLELSNCNITHLPDSIFSKLTKLKTLLLWRNSLEDLTEEQLQGLKSLEEMDISNNKIRSLRGLVAVTRSLRKLSAFANYIQELPLLSNMSSLEEIHIHDNRVPLKISPQAMASLSLLRLVDLSRSGIDNIPSDFLSASPGLKTLKLTGNSLTELSAGLFNDQTSLEDLQLNRNKLNKLNAAVFKPLRALKSLCMDYNNLTVLPPFVFSGQSSMLRLSISHNRLTSLSTSTLSGVPRLEELDLSFNQITVEERDPTEYSDFGGAFTQLKDLRKLDLSHNNLTSIPINLSSSAIYLEKLNLAYNKIDVLTGAGFISNKAIIDLTHNEIKTIYLEPADNSSNANPKPQRSTLLLDNNPFKCDCILYAFAQRLHNFNAVDTSEAQFEINDAWCSSPPSLSGHLLQIVPLQDFICVVDDNTCPDGCNCLFRSYTNTMEVTCNKAPKYYDPTLIDHTNLVLRLTEIPTSLNLTSDVRTLNLSGLALKDMPPGSLPISLKMLDLSRNNLTKIPRKLYNNDLTLKISRNPLICDCWHTDAVKEVQDNWWKIEDYDQVNCSSNVPISQVNVQQLCSTWRASVVGGVLAMLGILTAIAAMIILRYSFEIKVWLYARGMFARWFVIDDDDRKYDAFISFCHKDDEFVSEHLIPGLEDIPQPYKICIHYRDWMPGEFITTQIAQSVADSRRTIIVVSKNFLESQWARAEFRTANMTAIKERKTRVIVILLEDVNSHKELDPELKAYLSTNTYLKWGDPWFWDKLRYALPHRKADAVRMKRREKTRIQEKVAIARADAARKVVEANGIDTRLTADGVIINAAALALPKDNKKYEHINLDMNKLNNIKSMADMKPIQV